MQESLDRWEALVEAELAEFTRRYFEFIASDVRLIDNAIRYLQQRRGKMLRPLLALLVARLTGEVSEDTYKAAVIIELLHNATLLHDDVVDESDLRRGLPSLHRVFGRKAAVLMGDYLLAHSLIGMLDLRDFRVFEILSQCARRMARGELVQLGRARKRNIDRATYLRMIADKTGALTAATCELGALTSGAGREQQAALAAFGENLGIAFQIRDDILDYTGDSNRFGKPVGKDLREGKITLPLLHVLEEASPPRRAVLRLLLASRNRRAQRSVIRTVRSNGGIEGAASEAASYMQAAIAQLESLPESESRLALHDLAEFLLTRRN